MFQKIKVLGASLVTILALSGAVVVAQESQPAATAPAAQQTRETSHEIAARDRSFS